MPVLLVFEPLGLFYGIITSAGNLPFEVVSSLNNQQVNLVPLYGIAQ